MHITTEQQRHSTTGGNEGETRKVVEILMKFRVVGKLYHLARIPRVSRFCSFIFPFFSSFEYREIIRCFVFNRFKKLDAKETKKIGFRSRRGEIVGFDIVAVVQSYRVQTRGQS